MSADTGNSDVEEISPQSPIGAVLRSAFDEAFPSAMNCPPAWAGEHLDTYAYMLAGALSTIMMPPDMVMPSEQITEAIERLNTLGPGPWRSEDDL